MADACITLLVCLVFARTLIARDSILWKVIVVAGMTGVMLIEILTSLGDNLLVGAGGPLHAATASFYDMFVLVTGLNIVGSGVKLPAPPWNRSTLVFIFLMMNLFIYVLCWSSGILVDMSHKRKRRD